MLSEYLSGLYLEAHTHTPNHQGFQPAYLNIFDICWVVHTVLTGLIKDLSWFKKPVPLYFGSVGFFLIWD